MATESGGPWSAVGGVVLAAGIAIAFAWMVVVGAVVVAVGAYVMVAPLVRWWPWAPARVPKRSAAEQSAGSGMTVKGHKIEGNRHEGWYTTTGSGVHLVTEIVGVAFSKVCVRSETEGHSDRGFYEACVRPDDLPQEVVLGRRGLRRRGRIVVRDITDAGILIEERDTGQQRIRLIGYIPESRQAPDGAGKPAEVVTRQTIERDLDRHAEVGAELARDAALDASQVRRWAETTGITVRGRCSRAYEQRFLAEGDGLSPVEELHAKLAFIHDALMPKVRDGWFDRSDAPDAASPRSWAPPPASPTRPGNALLSAMGQLPDDRRRRAEGIKLGEALTQDVTKAQSHYAAMPVSMAAEQTVAAPAPVHRTLWCAS